MSLRASLCCALLVAGCANAKSTPPARNAEVRIPEATGTEASTAEPPAAVRHPVPVDPLDYFVGHWSGRVNGTIDTVLEVTADGRYRVRSDDSTRQTGCELSGRFDVDGDVLRLEVARSTCSVESIGSTLERRITLRKEGQFVVVSPDRSLTVRYTRRDPDG